MHGQDPRQLPILERIARWVPGYGGYLDRGNRRADDQRLRDAVAARIAEVKPRIEAAVRDAVDRGALVEINPLERLGKRVDLLADRLRHAGSGTDAFYSGSASGTNWAASLHGSDLALFDAADALVDTAAKAGPADLARALDPPLTQFEAALDHRARTLQGIH